MNLKLSIYITYDDDSMDPHQTPQQIYYKLSQQLYYAAEHLYDNGLLTGDADVTISECTHVVNLLT